MLRIASIPLPPSFVSGGQQCLYIRAASTQLLSQLARVAQAAFPKGNLYLTAIRTLNRSTHQRCRPDRTHSWVFGFHWFARGRAYCWCGLCWCHFTCNQPQAVWGGSGRSSTSQCQERNLRFQEVTTLASSRWIGTLSESLVQWAKRVWKNGLLIRISGAIR
jgi:hypothetical protein